LAGALAAAGQCSYADAQDQSNAAAPLCGGVAVADGAVSTISDGRTLTLADSREVRLAAIEVPAIPPLRSADPKADRWGAAAKAALDALAGGDRVVLRGAQADPDRYGRMVAYAYTARDGDQAGDLLFVQGELLADGFARVAGRVEGEACANLLLSRENIARKARLGLWGDPYYEPLDAEAPAEVLAHKGQFALVAGKVVSVRDSGPTIYLNFGQRWSEDFAVTVRKRNERIFNDAGRELKGLEGRRVIVRGFVEARGSRGMPSIEAERPEQIETADRD
jgi:endonuclease YncB( thermonuclease family)